MAENLSPGNSTAESHSRPTTPSSERRQFLDTTQSSSNLVTPLVQTPRQESPFRFFSLTSRTPISSTFATTRPQVGYTRVPPSNMTTDSDEAPSEDAGTHGFASMNPMNRPTQMESGFVERLCEILHLGDVQRDQIAEVFEANCIYDHVSFFTMPAEILPELSATDSNGDTFTLPKYPRMKLKSLQAFFSYRLHSGDESALDWSTYDFLSFLKWQNQANMNFHGGQASPTQSSNMLARSIKSDEEKGYDEWIRAKHDVTAFTPLDKEANYLDWYDKFRNVIKLQRLENLIDSSFKTNAIQDKWDRQLFERQNVYFWNVLDYVFATPTTILIMKHSRHKQTSHSVFQEIHKTLTDPIALDSNCGKLCDELCATRINLFEGTRTEYLAHWFNTLHTFNNSVETSKQVTPFFVRSWLRTSLMPDQDLHNAINDLDPNVKDTLKIERHIRAAARTQDDRDERLHQDDPLAIAEHVQIRFHDLDMPNNPATRSPAIREIFKIRHISTRGLDPSLRIPDHIFIQMSQKDKRYWRSLSDDFKRQILKDLPSKSSSPSPSPRKAYHVGYVSPYDEMSYSADDDVSFSQTSQISSKEVAQEVLSHILTMACQQAPSDMSTSHNLTSPPDNELAHHDDTSGLIRHHSDATATPTVTSMGAKSTSTRSKASKPLKSELGIGHPTRIMAQPSASLERNKQFFGTSKPNSKSPKYTQFSANVHHMCYEPHDHDNPISPSVITYNVSNRKLNNPEHMALVDRGANGMVAGTNCRVIGTPMHDRHVNITGMDNHQLSGVPICTVGAYMISQRGPVIGIFHEAAYTGRHQSILSCIQMEHYRNRVDDRSHQLGGGQQITTADGYNFPLSIVNGLAYLHMRAFSDTEYDTLPHVILTSEEPWNPREYDSLIDPNSKEYTSVKPQDLHLLPYDEYNVKGDLIKLNSLDIGFWRSEHEYLRDETVARCANTSKCMFAYDNELDVTPNPRTHKPIERDFEALKPKFAWMPTKMIKKTFENSTQYGHIPHSPDGNLFKRWKSPNPAMNIFRFRDILLTDTIYSNTKAIQGGHKRAQVFIGSKTHWAHIVALAVGTTFLSTLQNVLQKVGAPDGIAGDATRFHVSLKLLDFLRTFCIRFWQSEPYYQHQNPFERRYQTIKRLVNRTMDRTNTPLELWYLCLEYVIYILNRTADPSLNHKQPIFLATGNIGDISAITVFEWLEPVYFKVDNSLITFPDTNEAYGHFVGFAENVGHQMTFKIWNPSTKHVVNRSSVRSAKDTRFPNYRASDHALPGPGEPPVVTSDQDPLITQEYGEKNPGRPPDIKLSNPLSIFSDRDRSNDDDAISPSHPDYGEPDYFDSHGDTDTPGETPIPTVLDDYGVPMVILLDDDGNPKIDSQGDLIMVPGKSHEKLQGITFKKRQEDGSILRARVLGPLESNLESPQGQKALQEFKIRYDTSQVEDTMAYNDIMNYIYREQSQEDGKLWNYRRVLAHRGPLTPADKGYKHSKYNVSIEWENGEITEEALSWMIRENPIPMAEYARDNNLLDTEGWRQLRRIAKREKLLDRLVKQAKLRSYRTAPKYMFGFQIPRNYEEALELDRINGNTRWQDCTALEMQQLHDYHTFRDIGIFSETPIPKGFKKIRVHLVFAVKHDGRHKARLVADGHLTDVPLNSVYAGVISIRGLRMLIFLAELNGMEAWATDIGNAYLEAYIYSRKGMHQSQPRIW